MANLKEVRTRISSVQSTMQITSAMKMVAASKLRKAQNAIITMRPYASKLKEIMQNLSSNLEGSDDGIYGTDKGDEKVLLVPITSNRGLCGAFNANVVKETVSLINKKFKSQVEKNDLSLYCIGSKGADLLKSKGYNIKAVNHDIFDELTFDNVVEIAESLMRQFADGEYDKIIIIYNQFKNAASQIMMTEQFLPLVESESEEEGKSHQADFIFEPNKQEILDEIIPKTIKIQLYKAILDSFASEHGARMTAMHQATDNANDLLRDLKLTYNKARQAAITNEILEIVGGAEALNG
ncbi:MAG: ATP synthase F1 subunit gamma [Marinilabiliales bacterium]|nr:MAG: ATP synthase F1 subunit gamma [Marinilabiliales bacterium]